MWRRTSEVEERTALQMRWKLLFKGQCRDSGSPIEISKHLRLAMSLVMAGVVLIADQLLETLIKSTVRSSSIV